MAFSWTPIGDNTKILLATINEIRNNIDIVDNTKCPSHRSTVYSSEHRAYESGHKSGVLTGVDSSVQSSYDNSVDDLYYTSVDTSNWPGYYSGYESTVYKGDDGSVDYTDYSGYCSGDCGTNRYGVYTYENITNYSRDRTGVNTSADTSVRNSYDATYDSDDCSLVKVPYIPP